MNNRKLSTISVATGLVSIHYGLGFLLGTGEMIYKNGLSGSLYAFMCALGLLALSLLASFYWKNKYPIWTLLEKKYDQKVSNGIMFLSWLWMIGVVASQVLGATYIVNMLGLSMQLCTITVLFLIVFFSILPVEKLSKLLLALLLINSTILVYGMFKLVDIPTALNIVTRIPAEISSTSPMHILGIAIPTVLITMLGMDFHQFVVQAKDSKKSISGTILSSIILFIIVFIPTITIYAAKANGVFPQDIDGKQVVPFVLMYLGRSALGDNLSYLFLIAILTVLLGSGSCLFRILTKAFIDFNFLPQKIRKKGVVIFANSLFIFFLAMTGGTIVSLIVSFYVIYIAGVFIPFIAYLLHSSNLISFKSSTIYSSLISGSVISLLILIFSKANLLPTEITKNLEFIMISVGILTSAVTLLFNKLIEKNFK